MEENKKLLKRSLDMKYYRTQLILCGAVIGFIVLLVLLMSFFTDSPSVLWGMAVVYLAIMSPCIFFPIYRMREILELPADYRLYEAAVLTHEVIGRGRISFTLRLARPDGTTFTVETKGIFGRSIMTERYWGDAMGQKLRILYDEYAERVVVIERIDP